MLLVNISNSFLVQIWDHWETVDMGIPEKSN